MTRILGIFLATGTLAIFLVASQGWASSQPKKMVAQGNRAAPGPVVTPAPSGEGKAKKVKFRDKTDINFEDTLIEGTVKNPFASMVNTRDQEFAKGLIKIRYNWHDQLIMSVSGLSQ